METIEGRDPFANLRRLEEDRPGFHWRGTRSLKTLVHGAEDADDKKQAVMEVVERLFASITPYLVRPSLDSR